MVTCNHHTLVVPELLGEETRHNQLWVHEEKNLFLHEAGAQNTSTQTAVGKIHLNTFRKQKQTPLRTLPAGGPWVHGSVLTCSIPVPSVSMVPCDETYSLFIFSLQLTRNETSQSVNSIHYTQFVLVKSTDLQPGGFKNVLVFTVSRFGHRYRRGIASQMSPVRPVGFLQSCRHLVTSQHRILAGVLRIWHKLTVIGHHLKVVHDGLQLLKLPR